jgi:hypothetical protein
MQVQASLPLIMALLLSSAIALAQGEACGRDLDCPGGAVCEAGRCADPEGGKQIPTTTAPLPDPGARACVRQWVLVEGRAPKVRWCGRELDADQLLVPEARSLFPAGAPQVAFDLSLGAVHRSRVAVGFAVGFAGLGFSLFIGAAGGLVEPLFRALPPGPSLSVATVVFTAAALATIFVVPIVSLIVHAVASKEAIEQLHRAMDLLEQVRPSAPAAE